jgi:hypothetical protein
MQAVLPGPVLVLLQPKEEPYPWQQKWEAWRKQYFSWFPAFARAQEHLLFIEAATGKRLTDLSLPLTDLTHFFHKQQQALYLVGHAEDQVIIQKYAYPLHKPWLLILSWTLGVFAVLASLQWIIHKPRRTAKIR